MSWQHRRTTLDLTAGSVVAVDHRERLTPAQEEKLRKQAQALFDLLLPFKTYLVQVGPHSNMRIAPHTERSYKLFRKALEEIRDTRLDGAAITASQMRSTAAAALRRDHD